MAGTYKDFDDARVARQETLSLVEGVDQRQSEYHPGSGKWSVGQVLDHLVKFDTLIFRELEVAFNQRRSGVPFVYRGVADIDTTIPWMLRPVLPFFEIPFSFFNTVLPQPVRRALTGNRSVPIQAPRILAPRNGRRIETLREELGTTFGILEQQQVDNPEIDLNRVYYYNPLTGLATIAGLYRFISNHEQRHQGQLRDILGNPSSARPMLA